jgi:hypothetical protein
MNKNMIFRILGVLASALIIAAVFVPFVSVVGYSQSLWEGYKLTEALYLPIMIIVFGAIGVIFFSLNVKTEFAYMSTGAIAFFLVMNTIDVIEDGTFSTLSIGYYFLVVGAIVVGLMAFLINLKPKNNNNITDNAAVESSVLEQMDKLYSDPVPEVKPIQPINDIVKPVQPIVNPVPTVQEPVIEQPIVNPTPVVNPVNQMVSEPAMHQSMVNPIVNEQSMKSTLNQGPIVKPVTPMVSEPVIAEPVVNQAPVSRPNPVVQEFSQPINPTVQEFSRSIPVNPNPSLSRPNPVVQEFTNSVSPLSSQTSTGETDIFGQPINKS